MLVTQFISEIEIYSQYVKYLKDNPNSQSLAWMFEPNTECISNLNRQSGLFTAEEIWTCFTLSSEFDETRVTYKNFISLLLRTIISRIGEFVISGVQESNSFNLKFLVIVLLLITLLLGLSWIFILVKDNKDV